MDGIYEGIYCVTGGKRYKFGPLYNQFFKEAKFNSVQIEVAKTLDHDNIINTSKQSIVVSRTYSSDCKIVTPETFCTMFLMNGREHKTHYSFDRNIYQNFLYLLTTCEVSDNDLIELTKYKSIKEDLLTNKVYLPKCIHEIPSILHKSKILKEGIYKIFLPEITAITYKKNPILTYKKSFPLNVFYWLEETDINEGQIINKSLRIEVELEDHIDIRTNQIDPDDLLSTVFNMVIYNKLNGKVLNHIYPELRWRPTEEFIACFIYNKLYESLPSLNKVILHTNDSSIVVNKDFDSYINYHQFLGYTIKDMIGEL